uniref:Protein BTG1 n=1 Tax=Sarcophilus harrisii TaxID=9305 RepID=A0A7N4Q031_SARHA
VSGRWGRGRGRCWGPSHPPLGRGAVGNGRGGRGSSPSGREGSLSKGDVPGEGEPSGTKGVLEKGERPWKLRASGRKIARDLEVPSIDPPLPGVPTAVLLLPFTEAVLVLLGRKNGEHYKHHWFPEKPCKGSGYRCIRINHKMDPLIGQAAQRIGLSSQELFRLLPSELTLWVDPYEVSYRIGEDGSICVLYEASPAGGSTQNSNNMQMVDSRISCKEELLLGRTSPSKNYNMMTVSG